MKQYIIILTLIFGIAASSAILAAAPDGSGPWADSAISWSQGLRKDGTPVDPVRSDPTSTLGIAETTGTPSDVNTTASNFFSLGFGGTLTVGFDNAISNGSGADLMVYEVTGGAYPDELVRIEASHNGIDWVTLASSTTRDSSVDLGILPCAKYVKLTDVSNPALFDATADGYDVDAFKALNNGTICNATSTIAIDKTADQTEVFPGETVNYSYAVTNNGDFSLSSVSLVDDKCATTTGPTGDDGDGIFEAGETWNYACSMPLDVTTTNVATVTARDPWNHEISANDNWTVAVKRLGCTLTQGYWKNHSLGSKNEDVTWDTLGSQAGFWLDVLDTPVKGNAWYQLAHQYVAALLNSVSAYVPANIQSALNSAQTLLGSTPFSVPKSQKAEFINLAGILAGYNEGATEVPHCSE